MNSIISRTFQTIVVLITLLLLLLLLIALLNSGNNAHINFLQPGSILFSAFHLASFFIPLHLVLLLFLLRNEARYWQSIVIWGSFIVPFLTMALAIRIILWDGPTGSILVDAVVQIFGKYFSVSMLSLAVVVEIAVLFRVYSVIVSRIDNNYDNGNTAGAADAVDAAQTTEPRENTQIDVFSRVGIMPQTFEQRYTPEQLAQRDEPVVIEYSVSNVSLPETAAGTLSSVQQRQRKIIYLPGKTTPVQEEKNAVQEQHGQCERQELQGCLEMPGGQAEAPEGQLQMQQAASSQNSLSGTPERENVSADAYTVPLKEFFIVDDVNVREDRDDIERIKTLLRETLDEFGIDVEVTGVRKGSSITCFEVLPSPGIKLTRISNLADNIALRLAAESVRIVSPIPGKHAVGIEIPNRKRELVRFGNMIHDNRFFGKDYHIPIALGESISGEKSIIDLAMTPHILIAGATGSGKSVCVNAIICSILAHCSPERVKLILIDPKIVELSLYNDVPHLLTSVITQPSYVFQALQYCIYEMEHRYKLLESIGVRNIASYNRKIEAQGNISDIMPYIVVIIDEFADLMATTGKEMENVVARLAAMSRAVGIHMVLATQRPSTDVITGLIKANIPSRIAFMVASKVDSRIILDCTGAEKLLGRGDMLFTSAWQPFPNRIQGVYISEQEMEALVNYVRTTGTVKYIDDEIFIDEETEDLTSLYNNDEDVLLPDAVDIVRRSRKASTSYLQRRLKIGYNRAARLIDVMEDRGIVGPQNGSKARDILIE